MESKDDEITVSAFKSVTDFILELKEDSDRAVVIVSAANIDTLLEKLIRGSLLPPANKKEDELFNGNSSLSTFSSKINLCYRLALIDTGLRQMLHILKRIRNDFAHQIKNCDLCVPPHSNRVAELVKYLQDAPLVEKLRPYFVGYEPNSRDFRIVVSLVSSLLEMKLRNLPTSICANPASIAWIPRDIDMKALQASPPGKEN